MRLRLGTRRSTLATTQSRWVAAQLSALGHDVDLVEITTLGDISAAPLTAIGGTGVFVSALRQALVEGQIDLAVHSFKDLPAADQPGLLVAAVPIREDTRDALVARDGLTVGELPAGAVIGTGSPRRAAQVAALGLPITVRAIRGNVDSRIRLVRGPWRDPAERLDAVILARAGLARLGRLDEVTQLLDHTQFLPAAGQGALAVEIAADRADLADLLRPINHPDTAAAVAAERAVLAHLGAGCSAAIGVFAEVVDDEGGSVLAVRAVVFGPHGTGEIRRSLYASVEDPPEAGRRLADILMSDGAAELLGPAEGIDATSQPRSMS